MRAPRWSARCARSRRWAGRSRDASSSGSATAASRSSDRPGREPAPRPRSSAFGPTDPVGRVPADGRPHRKHARCPAPGGTGGDARGRGSPSRAGSRPRRQARPTGDRAPRDDRRPRLRLAVHPADRPAASGTRRLLRDPPLHHERRGGLGPESARSRALRGTRERLWRGCPGAAARTLRVPRRVPGAAPRRVLRNAAPRPRERRRCPPGARGFLRPGGTRADRRWPPVRGSAAALPRLGEPRRPGPRAPRRIPTGPRGPLPRRSRRSRARSETSTGCSSIPRSSTPSTGSISCGTSPSGSAAPPAAGRRSRTPSARWRRSAPRWAIRGWSAGLPGAWTRR